MAITYEFKMATGGHLEFQPSEEVYRCPQSIFWLYKFFENYDEYVNLRFRLVAILNLSQYDIYACW